MSRAELEARIGLLTPTTVTNTGARYINTGTRRRPLKVNPDG